MFRFPVTILTPKDTKKKSTQDPRFLIQKPQPILRLSRSTWQDKIHILLTASFSKFTIAKFLKSAFHSYLYTPVDESSILPLHKLDFVFHRGCNRYYKHIGLYLRACNYDRLFFRYLYGLAIDRRLVGISQGKAAKSGNKTKKRRMCYHASFFEINSFISFL